MEYLFREWLDIGTPKLTERNFTLELLPKKVRKIITFTGIRRCGKTYLMFQLINKLQQSVPVDHIFYINFEDERLEKSKENLTNLISTMMKLYGNDDKNYYLFLDEVHVMPEWSRWLRRVYDDYRNINFFVSGSSSKLSSKEIPTELRGRALNYEIFPLDFREFIQFKNIILEKNFEYSERKMSEVKRALAEHIEYGGFPEVVLEESLFVKRRLIQEYFKTIIARDIAERYNIKNSSLLTDFLRLLLNTKYFSVNKSVNIIRSQGKTVGKQTLINYTRFIEQSYLCFFVPIFSYKIKDQMKYPKKVYFTDNSFLTTISIKFSKNYGTLYENLVAVELCRRKSRNPQLAFYYWKDRNGKEVDFVLVEYPAVKQLIQVCYDVRDYDIKKREVTALLKASKELNCKNLLIITDDYEGTENQIVFKPLWKWLFSTEF